MATVAHVDARFTADTSAYVRSVRDAQRATQQLADSLPSADSAMGSMKASTIALGAALGTLGAQALTRATGLVKQFAMQGIQAAKDYEQTVISIEGIFQGMGMSVEQATEETKGYLADLRDFAAETPFELPQTLDAVKRLLSIGYAADDVKDNLLPAIGDIVSALGQPAASISAVVYAFGQMKSAGRVLSQDLMQIGNALPGFNAKVAIAEQLFSGDMQAMAKAMESGALDSEMAIQAIIKAMQEFPGAAGAMERQSKTLAGVMSTFSDTVNNALIDGLMPSMPMLSEALMGVMPAVEAMATAFAQQLGPALIQGAELMEAVVPVASALIPPIFELVDLFTGMSEIVAALAGPLVMLADGLGSLIDLFNALPGPVKTAIAVLTTLFSLSRRYSEGWTTANKRVLTSFTLMRAGAATTAASVGASMMNARIAIETLQFTAKRVATGVAASFAAIRTAARTLMSSLGPIGWALIGVSVAFEVLSGKSAQAEEMVAKLKDTIDETTGAFTKMSAEMMGTQFRLDLSPEDQATLASLGISVNDAVKAIMDGGPAIDEFRAKIDSLQGVGFTEEAEQLQSLLQVYERNFNGMVGYAEETTRIYQAEAASRAEAEYQAAMDQMAANKMASAEYRRAAAERRAADEETYSSLSGLAYAHKNYADLAVRNQDRVTAVTQATEGAVRALQTAYLELESLFSDVRAADRAHTALQEMQEQLKANADGIDGYSGAALENRNAVLSYADAQIAYAKSLQDPQAELQALMDLEAEVKASLKDQDIKPADSALYQSIKGSIDAAKGAVEDMGDAVTAAETAGLDITNAIAAGIAAGMTEQESAINASGLAGGDTLIQGMLTGAGVSSPSTYAIEAGNMVGLGLVQGLVEMSGQVRNTGNTISNALIQGMIVSLNNGQGPVAAAARRVVAAAIAAAKAEGEIKSPSKVFMEIGDDLIAGLKLGWSRGAKGFVQDIARTVQDAWFAMKDAQDAVKDAEKALAELRKSGDASARELAAAQRAVAMAYRDAADAAKAFAAAQRNVRATQRLARMGKADISQITAGLMGDLAEGRGIGDAWDKMSQRLYDRARRAGMTREAAQAYADSVMGQVEARFEKELRRLGRLTERLNEINAEIEAVQDRMAAREDARKSLAAFMERRFGQSSDFEKAYNAAEIGVDQAIQLFDDFEEMVRARLDGYEEGMADPIVEYLRTQTQSLVDLINKREALRPRLEAAQKDLEDLLKTRDDAQKRFTESILNFSKISGKVSSADEFITGLEQRAAATKQYIENIEALRKRGVASSLLQQILEAGPEQGGSFAAVLAGASDEQIKYINTLTAQNQETAAKFGESQASVMYDAGITAQKSLVAGLQAEYDGVIAQINTTVTAIKDKLAPLSSAGYEAGKDLLAQTLAGLEAEKTRVLAAIEAIGKQIAAAWQAAVSPPKPAPGAPSGGSGGSGGGKGKGKGTGRSAIAYVPAVPASTSGITVASGGVQVQVAVGDGTSPGTVSTAVKAAVMEALSEVAMQASNARR